MNSIRNLLYLDDIDFSSNEEIYNELLSHKNFYIERIVSYGQTSEDWYNQDMDEWLVLLQGEATILYENRKSISLTNGDSLHIPAHEKHKVTYTSKKPPCIWLAIFFE